MKADPTHIRKIIIDVMRSHAIDAPISSRQINLHTKIYTELANYILSLIEEKK